MAQTRLFTYYEGIETLGHRLPLVGAQDWAEALTAAIRGGSTSGEILSNTGAILRDLAESTDAGSYNVEEEVTRLQTECHSLWNGDTK